MEIEDIIGVVLILILGVFCILHSLYKMKVYDYDKLSSHPGVQIGKKFEWRIHSNNPFESDSVSIVEIIDLKEECGVGWVKYRCIDDEAGIYTEPISSFVDKYDTEVNDI